MKRLLILLLFFIPIALFAQKLPDYGFDKVRITENNIIIQAETKPTAPDVSVKAKRFYYWYSANQIHITQGGYSGRLLNGLYNVYYEDRNLKEQGAFKEGLKDGTWKNWNEDGTISETTTWKNGVLIPPDTRTFWQKLNIFKRKDQQTAKTDTVKSK